MVGIITYNCPHKKTAEIINRCSEKIDLILIIPFEKRIQRNVKIHHRQYQFIGPTPQDIGNNHAIDVVPLESLKFEDNKHISELIIGGAGLLPESIVSNFRVINCHSGLIPTTRGLDSFKWAIYFKELMGVTIHKIDNNVDLGSPIHHSRTFVQENDDIKILAERHYKNEISTLCEYISGSLKTNKIYNLEFNPSRRRMSIDLENLTLRKFQDYKKWAINEQKIFL